ncbi:MAG: DUF2914 domain-containing protein [Thermodesulfobacteriota bacterium]
MPTKWIHWGLVLSVVFCFSAMPCFGQEDTAAAQPTAPEAGTSQEAASQPETAPPASAATPQAGIQIHDAVICRHVSDRMPIEPGETFGDDVKSLSCFVRVTGAAENDGIIHNWYHGEKLVAGIALHVGANNWRTYSTKSVFPGMTGNWRVEVLSKKDNSLLKTISFVIQ